MKKLLTFLTLLVLAYGVGWAAENDVHDAGISFSKLLNNNASIDPVSISAPTYPIKTVTINWRYNKSTANVVTIEVKVGGTSWGTQSVGTNTTSDAIFNGTPTIGAVEITFTNNAGSGTGKGTFYVNSVSLTEGASSTVTKYDVTLNQSTGGTISANPTSAAEGTKVTLTATPNDGYDFTGWTVIDGEANEVTVTNNQFEMPASDVEVEATFTAKPTRNITVTTPSNGTLVTSPSGSTWVGNTVTVTATPDTGYALDEITVNGNAITGNTFTMPDQDVTVAATFVKSTNAMIVFGDNGSDATSDVTASSLLDYTTTGASYVSSYSDISKVYKATTGIKFSSGSVNGTLTINLSAAAQQPISKIIVNAKKYGSDVASLSVNGTSTGTLESDYADYEITCDGSTLTSIELEATKRLYVKSITLVFAAQKAYTISVDSGITNGTVEVSPTSSDGNENITVTATPDTGYELSSLTYTPDGGSATTITASGGVYSFTMPAANVTVTATFTQVKYNILRTITTNGESSTAGGWLGAWTGWADEPNATDATGYTVNAYYGSTVTFKAGTNSGYQVGTVTAVDGSSNAVALTVVSSDNTGTVYSFTMPASAVTITANFVTYHPTVKLGGHVNGSSTWIDAAASGVALTYDSTNDKYTGRVFFTGTDDGGACDYFFVFEDATAKYPSASGNYWITSVDGTEMTISLTGGSSSNFRIVPGIYDIELNGGRTSLKVTQVTPTLTFTPASGASVQTGSTASVSSDLPSLISAIDANATVTVGVAEAADASSWASSYTFVVGDVSSKTLYGKAYIGNIAVTGSATYTVSKADNSNKYQLATTLTAGKKYLVVCEGKDVVMGAFSSSNSRFLAATTGTTLDTSNHIVTLSDGYDATILMLNGSAGAWTLADGSNYLSWSSGNTITESSTATNNNEKWTITFSGNNAVIVNNADATRQLMRNSGNDIFACYTGTQTAVQLYQQVASGDYKITYETVENGSASGVTDANGGDQITVTLTAAGGYAPNGITVTGVAAADITDNGDGTYTFTMPASNVTVTPSFIEAHSITYVSNPTGKATVTGNLATASYGTEISVTVSDIDSDYQLSQVNYTYNGITQQCAGSGPYTFSMPGYDVTVTAELVKKPHAITLVNASERGSVTGLPATATSGTSVTFAVTPASSTYTPNTPVVTFENSNEQTQTVSLNDNGNGTYTFAMPAFDVTVTVTYSVPFESLTYKLIKNNSDLEAGVTYLITKNVTGESGSRTTSVMGKMDGTSAAAIADVEVTEDGDDYIIASNENMAVVTLGGSTGAWTLQTVQGYLHNDNNQKNKLYTSQSVTGYATIELNSSSQGAGTVIFNAPATYNQLQYNSGSPRFAAYNGNQGKVYFWKEYDTGKVKQPVITDRGTFIGVDVVTITCSTAGATIEYSLDGGETWETYSDPFEITATAAGQTVTVEARATKQDMTESNHATATFTCGKPTAPTFGTNVPGDYVNPMFVYPKSALADRNNYGAENVSFYYVTDGSTTGIYENGTEVTTSNSKGKYVYLDNNCNLQVVVVINGIASDPAGGAYTFSVAQPVYKFRNGTYASGGNYDGEQEVGLSTATKTEQNNVTWTTKMYYTTTATAFAFDTATGEPTGAAATDWVEYTAGSYITIPAGRITELRSVTVSNYMNGKAAFVASAVTDSIYTVTAANLKLIATPASGSYLNAQNVTLTTRNAVGEVTTQYEINWADGSPKTSGTYSSPLTINKDATLYATARDSRDGSEGNTAEITAVYKIGAQAPTYSPIPGDYYSGTSITVQMFSVTPNAKVYYTMTDDGSEPADPTTGSTLYSGDITLLTGKTYKFKAISVVGSKVSAIAPATYTISAADGNIQDIATMNEMTTGSSGTLSNPFQVVYMSTWRHNGSTPEFCYVRDNSGYGLIYFGNEATGFNNYAKFNMGDWLPGDATTAKVAKWSDGFHNEFGSSDKDVTAWPSAALGNSPILPETTTNAIINSAWRGDQSFTGTNYADYIAEDNLWGHYVHMRKNTINVTSTGTGGGVGKHGGKITDESGVELYYYDGFYNFSGYNGTPDYGKSFFDNIQNNGGTFDIYAIVVFYGPNAKKSSANYSPFEIFPIDFKWIYKPVIAGVDSGTTYHEAKTVSLSCATEGAQIWYKTSQMESFESYTGPFTVDQTTTIEAYSTLPVPEYNDEMESVINSVSVTFGSVEQPVISPESSMNAVGDPAIAVTITCETEGATIWYTLDGSDPKTSETRLEYTGETSLSFSKTTTVRAIAEADDFYSVEAEARTYTFVKSNGIVYDLVTSASQLNENYIYVIVNKQYAQAMQRTQKADNRDGAGVLFTDATKTKVNGNDDLAVFTMKKNGSNWVLHTSNGSDNASIGYIFGATSGGTNQLRTDFTKNADQSRYDATITIGLNDSDVDKAYAANINYIWNGESTRYLRFNKTYGLFNTYSSDNTGQEVFLYYKEAFPLANIEVNGKVGNDYTIADELIGVYAVGTKLWAKDQGNVSIIKTENTGNWIDYVAELEGRKEEWDQSNWVCLDFSDYGETDGATYAGSFEGHLIPPASLTGTFTDDLNYTLLVKNAPSVTPGAAETYSLNVLNPANFNTAYLNQGEAGVEMPNGRKFWFVNPKVQEVVEIHNAVWDGDKFVVPARQDKEGNTSGDVYYSINGNGFEGGFTVDLSMNNGVASLQSDYAYSFTAIVTRTDWNYGRERAAVNQSASPAPRRIAPGAGTASSSITVMPLDLTGGTITEVKDLPDTVKEVKAVRYIDVIGRVSEQPFEGVNIVVTEYTDGTTSTRKVLK